MPFLNFSTRKSSSFSTITLGLASPEQILEKSFGEVLKPETINYRSYKPEKDGLFCEKIFGPVKDWECHCGKYKRIRYRGIVCDRCGVEVTRKTVRRERTGHITLAVPVVHIWFLRSIPSKISYLLGFTTKQLESIAYYEKFVVTNPGNSGRSYGELLDEKEFLELDMEFGIDTVSDEDVDEDRYFEALMGGEAIRRLLVDLNVSETIKTLSEELHAKKISNQKKENLLKRLRVLKQFDPRIEKKIVNKPEWMVITILSVIPPELRPLVPLDGGRFAASDLNDLYRRVIIRNNRLKQLIDIKAPDVILRNEKRMLQEAVDALLDNSRLQSAVRSGTRRPLKSLSDSLKGKTGRFRQNLLGKRVDYSGRSVIVVGPELRLHECGLPKEMAIELFKPLVVRQLIERGFTRTPRSAKMMVERNAPEVYKVLEYVVRDHPVLLNRAPTLHRLGIQAFQPILVDGRAIKLHPLVCAAFNADFDGDQMAVHVPLSAEAKTEAWLLMLSSHNILHPANGKPIAIPSQDMVLGIYYLTRPRKNAKGAGTLFSSYDEAQLAVDNELVDVHAVVDYRFRGKIIKNTTVGRILFNGILPEGMQYFNTIISKKKLEQIVFMCYKISGNFKTVAFLDKLKNLGFEYAFRSGTSIAIDDIHIPDRKKDIINSADTTVSDIQLKYDNQILTEGERYNKIIDVWTHTTQEVASEMFVELEQDREGFNPLYTMADSGARGSQDQIKQLAGMRGLMAKPKKSLTGSSGEIIENPIKSNFKEGLSVFEYFISTHGARKGLADTALKTADAGYLTRRLVDVAQDVTISMMDCGTIQGVVMEDLKEGEEIIEPLSDRIYGRTTLEPVIDPLDGKEIVPANELIDLHIIDDIEKSNVYQVKVRSILTCEAENGICARCYGLNLALNKPATMGDVVGIMAAQSIGEPGTQLTLRTFHIGGTASRIVEISEIRTKKSGQVRFNDLLKIVEIEDEDGSKSKVSIVRNGKIDLFDKKGRNLATYNVPYGAKVFVNDGDQVKANNVLFAWDPYTDVILARTNGIVRFRDMIEGDTFIEEAVEGGKKMIVITESRNRNLNPHIEIESTEKDSSSGGMSVLPVKATVIVKDGQAVKAGEILVKISREAGKTRDITGGLPRIAELFEARKPSDPAVVTEIDGRIRYGKIKRGIREILIIGKDVEKTYKIPYGKHIIVHDGDFVVAGDRLCEGAVSPQDILAIRGASKVQEYLVDQIQEVYRLQGVTINDKHIEVIVRQMMQKVEIEDPGHSGYLPGDRINRFDVLRENRELNLKRIITDRGDSDYSNGDVVYLSNIEDINLELKEAEKSLIKFDTAQTATFKPLLLGITRASLNTNSFISAASFQETTRVLTDAAVQGKTDYLRGLKENVIIGRLIPAGTGTEAISRLEVRRKD
ncbi:MAG: DNA-directed RNA polymerase subunit beta', partial [Fidelibacterota bacterium]